MKVLILDGNENQAVAATRSLARAGHRVSVGASTRWSKAGWSRDSSSSFQYPDPASNSTAFLACIANEAAREPGTLVLPMTELTTLPISSARDTILQTHGRLVLPPHDTVLRAFDKRETTRLARSLGIDVPETTVVSSDADIRSCARDLRYPVVLKPQCSHEVIGSSVRTTGTPVYARTANECIQRWRDLATRCRSVLVQEFVHGTGIGYFALMREGECLAEFAHRRIRDVRPTGSGSSLRISIAVPRLVADHARAVLSALKWHGVAMVEFRMRADGTPVFLEVNGRFWNSLALPVAAGVDFPAMMASLAEHGRVSASAAYRSGVRCRWLLGDVRHLVEVWLGPPAGYAGSFPSRMRTLADVVRPIAGTHHDNFTWRDPLPELGDWLHFVCRRLPRHARGRSATEVWHAEGRPSHS